MFLNSPAQFGGRIQRSRTAFDHFTTGHSGWDWRRKLSPPASTPLEFHEATFARSPKMARLEAALFVADRALSLRKLTQMATLADTREAQTLVDQLNEFYDVGGSAYRIERVAAGFKMLTLPRLSKWIDRIHDRQAYLKLSPPAMETLSVIAYRQPCTRADVEAIRGVQAAEMIKQLMERNLIRVVGEDDSLGRPYLYGTTKLFLESFGLTQLDQLPMADQLMKRDELEHAVDAEDGDHEESALQENAGDDSTDPDSGDAATIQAAMTDIEVN